MKKIYSLALLSLCLGGLTASAQNYYEGLHTGIYVGARGAYTLASDLKGSSAGITGASIGLKDGYDVSGSIGYRIMLDEINSFKFLETRLPWALRFEVEGGYGENDFDLAAVGVAHASGNLKNYRVMTNAFLDIPLTDMFYVSFGGGIGWINAKLSGSGAIGGFTFSGSASDNSFVYQGGVALGAMLNDYWGIELSYRALSYTDLKFGGATFEAPLVNMLGISVTAQF